MGLFSKFKRRPKVKIFGERELEFSRAALNKAVIKLSEDLYHYRHDTAHTVFSEYLRAVLNLEILSLSEGKWESADFAYQRGRVDGLRHALNLREKFIMDKETMRHAKVKSDHEAKRSYVRPVQPTTAAGLSI